MSAPIASTLRGDGLRWAGLIGILVIAALRCLATFAAQAAFDTDPAFDPSPLAGFSPAASMLLDALLIGFAATFMFGESRAGPGGRIDWKLWLLAFIPIPMVAWHGLADAGNLWRGSTWAAAAIAAVAIAHAARDRSMRSVILATLVSIVALVLVRGAAQITSEHAGTVQAFEANKARILADHGWPEGSSAARIFERRLRQPQPTGWFDTSNIFASLAGSAMLIWIGLAIAATRRARLARGWPAALLLAAIAAAVLLWMTGSKGAVGAIGLAMLFMLGLLFRPSWLGKSVLAPGAIAVGLAAFVILAIIARGTILPEGFAHEKSLLFRWHYLIGSARMIHERPWTGIGPDGFQSAYMLHRPPQSPEEVVSAHSMFIDWLATLGLSGAAWIGLALTLLWRTGRNAGRTTDDHDDLAVMPPTPSEAARFNRLVIAVALILTAALGIAMAIEWPALDDAGIRVRIAGAAAAVIIAFIMMHVLEHVSPRLAAIAIAGGIVMLAMHGQIEMTFHQPGSAVWAMCMLGAGGAGGAIMLSPSEPSTAGRGFHRLAGFASAFICLAIAGHILFRGCLPAFRQEAAMRTAAAMLAPVAAKPDDRAAIIAARQAAAKQLEAAYDLWPANVLPLNAAATQLELACSLPDGPRPVGLLQQALDISLRAVAAQHRSASRVIAINLAANLGQITGDSDYWNVAIELSRQVAADDPHGLGAWRRLGDVLWLAGRKPEAAEAYRKALAADVNFTLDELKQLGEAERSAIRERAGVAGETGGTGGTGIGSP